MNDFIVVGSGPCGAQAAQTLVELGGRVLMLDAGITPKHDYASITPDEQFLDIRRTCDGQHRFFLGENFEGISLGDTRTGSSLPPPRKYITGRVDELTPSRSANFMQLESLALGGLGAAWGLGSFTMSDNELIHMGLCPAEMRKSYDCVSARIGISADTDNIFAGGLGNALPALEIDESAEILYQHWLKKKSELAGRGIHVAKTPLALLSRDFDGRRACQYHDMEFWSDHGAAAYRPQLTIDRLKKSNLFEYRPGALVTRFKSYEGRADVEYLDLQTMGGKTAACRKLVLASGVFGTARIALRSFGMHGQEIPLLCNQYYYVLCMRPGLFGRELRNRRHSMGQLVMAYDARGDQSHLPVASILSYRSLLLSRLIKDTPLACREAIPAMKFLHTGFTIAGIHFPDYRSELKSLRLEPGGDSPAGDHLQIDFSLKDKEKARIHADKKALFSGLRKLGCWPAMTVDPGHGASIHYAGTLPFGTCCSPLLTYPDGRLNGLGNVFVADGSPFTFLPAKGITLTLMAYADFAARMAAK
ncbi:MAG: hypothetical protein A2583_00020 [Bdellovibrionales bacterium RIFOXYD1_FULL_53_11]|nr:MAG: hypothetical protein A2583_00020 [Bdellovibrionales bacterium RIFOXYD1_FULL_53_11]